jgi:hypothetical protein
MRRVGCLVVLAVLAALLFGADTAARVYAQHSIEQHMKRSAAVNGKVTVRIRGFPFLLEAARRRISIMDVDATRVGTQWLELTRMHAVLYDVRPNAALTGARAGTVEGAGFISFADLLRAATQPGLSLSDGGGGRIRIREEVRLDGHRVRANALGRVRVDGDALVVHAEQIEIPGLHVGPPVLDALGHRLDVHIPIRGLPRGLQLTGVTAGPHGVTADLRGHDVPLAG